MKSVTEYLTLRPGLFTWQGYEPEVKCDCSTTAIVTEAGLVFIDPIPLREAALKELIVESFAAPAAVVLTSGNHQRESLILAKRLGIPVFAPENAGDDIAADHWFVSGEDVSGMTSISLSGFGPAETALYFKEVLIFGDALINLEPEGLRLLPEKYRTDKTQALRSLVSLQKISPKIILFAHGNPIVQRASEKLLALLGSGAK